MNPAEIFIRRPVMTTLLMAAIVIFGIMAYRMLPVSDLPEVDYPAITVSAALPGASPKTMAASVATPLEKQFSNIAGMRAMNSTSQQGQTTITLQFHLHRNINNCALDVQAAISRAEAFLPHNMPTPPSFLKVNPADYPIIYIAVTARTLPLYTLDKYAETLMAQNMSTVSGVAQVAVYGSQIYAVRVQLNPNLLASRGVDINQVAAAVRHANVELPTGTVYGHHTQYTIRATGQLKNAAAYRRIIVTYKHGSPLRVDQLGRAINSVQNNKLAGWFGDQRAVILAVQRQPGTNTIAVVNGIRKLLPHLRAQIPAAISYHVVYDRSQEIRQSVSDVKFTLLLALIFVVIVIFLFLRNIRATIIPSLAIPVSLIGTFACMYMLHFTVDDLSLLALTLCIGFVVDDTIVMLENSVRHMEMGQAAFPATLIASREIGFTIVSMTLSLTAVFIPILFMGGMLGRLLNEFAVTIACAILISGFVSLTLTPMLCSRFLKPPKKRHNFLYNAMESVFQGMLWLYERCLRMVLRARLLTLIVSAVILAATVYMLVTIPRTLFPTDDMGQLFCITQARQGISFHSMARHQMALMHIVKKDPNVQAFVSFYGSGMPIGGANSGIIFIHLKSPSKRKDTIQQVQQELGAKLNSVTGIRTYIQIPPTISLNGTLTKGEYQYTLTSFDTKTLYKDAAILTKEMQGIKGTFFVSNDLQITNPQVKLKIDRNRAKVLGVNAADIEQALEAAYGSEQSSTIYTSSNEYYVILELEPKFQRRPDQIPLLYLHSKDGKQVPLSAVTQLSQNVGPLQVNHMGQLPSVTISYNLLPGASLSYVDAKISSEAKKLLPPSVSTGFQGAAQVYQSSVKSLGLLLVIAIAVIYMVLGILYESFIHPLTILTALPFAGFGALITLKLFHSNLNLYSFVGIIMLIGLVKKNGIMIVDFAIAAQRDQGKTPLEAIYQACVVRFRPIMMTTMAALVGALPIALGIGAGGSSRQSLGLAVVGGLLFSQLLTLFVTPVFYVYMEGVRKFFGGGNADSDANGISRTMPADHARVLQPA